MKFHPLTDPAPGTDTAALEQEYKAARAVGALRIGQRRLYFKNGLRTYYIPYEDVGRLFRRVVSVPARLCCGKGELAMENLVICAGDGRELAQAPLPDARAARLVMEQLQDLTPHAAFGRPDPDKETTKHDP